MNRGGSLLDGLLAPKHCDALVEVSGFPERNHDIENSEAGNGSAKPIGCDSPLQHGNACSIGQEDKQIVLTPVPKERVPGRQDQIEPEQEAENYEKNDGQFLNHVRQNYNAFRFFLNSFVSD